MSSANNGRFGKSMEYLAWYYSAGALLDVYHDNQRREKEGNGIKASADLWAINERLRADVHERACRFWSIRTGLNHTYFPLSVDAAARLYFRIRKRQQSEVEAFDAEVEEACRLGKLNGSRGEDE